MTAFCYRLPIPQRLAGFVDLTATIYGAEVLEQCLLEAEFTTSPPGDMAVLPAGTLMVRTKCSPLMP